MNHANHIEELILRYKNSGILIDTNILLCYLVGLLDTNKIPSFKRTAQFVQEDFKLLCTLVGYFKQIVTTPNILAEVNSLSQQLREPDRTRLFEIFSRQIQVLDEHYVESRIASERQEFTRVGLTDSGIISLSPGKYLVLTDDFRLTNFLSKNGVDVINFNHIRVAGWS
jgi:rRNA-processing protein FCF1